MSELFNVNQRLSNFIQKQLNAKGETTDENRPIGSKATLNGKDVFWSGQNYGWQSQESFDKLKEGPEFRAGHIALSRLGTDINQAIGMGVDALPEPVKQTGVDLIRQGVQAYQSLPQGVRTSVSQIADTAVAVNESVSKATNVSPIITGEVLTAGAGKLVKGGTTVGARQIARAMPEQGVAYGLTIGDPRYLAAGVREGIAKEPGFAEWMQKWTARRNELRERMRYPEGLTPKRRQANLKRAKETAYNDVSTGPSRFTDDPEAYGIKEYKQLGTQQHHLFPKQESYQFVERMREIGDDDDVINLFLYAEELDASMGGRLSNMLNMDVKPHSKLHSNRIKDKRQLDSMKMRNRVESAKSTDELMEMFDEYIVKNIRPSKQEAKELQEAFKQTKIKMNQARKLEASLSEAARRRL